MINLVLLGSGNVATHLYKAFFASEESLKDFKAETAVTTSLSELMEADIYLLALKDDVIPDVAQKISHLNGLVAHTSGSVT